MSVLPVMDQLVEGDEMPTFVAMAENPLDIFLEGMDTISFTLFDDDGTLDV